MLNKLLAFALLIPAATPQPQPADFPVCITPPSPPLLYKHRQQGGAILYEQGRVA